MTKYQMIVLFLIASSIITVLFDMMAADKKGLMYQLQRIFMVLTLLAVLLLGYRAFFLIR
jgi:hypothetical protein